MVLMFSYGATSNSYLDRRFPAEEESSSGSSSSSAPFTPNSSSLEIASSSSSAKETAEAARGHEGASQSSP